MMKPLKLIHPRSREVASLASIFALIAISFACSASKSAGSPSAPNNSAPASPSAAQEISAASQEKPPPCTMTLAGAPVLNGFRVGMTKDEVLAAFPGSKDNQEVQASLARPANKIGTSDLQLRPEQYKNKDSFAGI